MKRSFVILCVLAWLGVVGWAATIYYCSTMTGQEVEHVLPWHIWDKALHFGIFTVGAALLAAALRITAGWPWRVVIVLTIVLLSIYGASDEYHQTFTAGRSGGDVGDWTADSLGAIVGALTCGICAPRRRRL